MTGFRKEMRRVLIENQFINGSGEGLTVRIGVLREMTVKIRAEMQVKIRAEMQVKIRVGIPVKKKAEIKVGTAVKIVIEDGKEVGVEIIDGTAEIVPGTDHVTETGHVRETDPGTGGIDGVGELIVEDEMMGEKETVLVTGSDSRVT